MKRFFSLCLIWITAVFVLTACGGQTAVDVEAEPSISLVAEEAVVEEVVVTLLGERPDAVMNPS